MPRADGFAQGGPQGRVNAVRPDGSTCRSTTGSQSGVIAVAVDRPLNSLFGTDNRFQVIRTVVKSAER